MKKRLLIETLDDPFIKLPLQVMRMVGPAVMSYAAIIRDTSNATFKAQAKLAALCNIDPRAFRNHLATLIARGLVENRGRGHTKAGAPRRTCTIKLTPVGRAMADARPTKNTPIVGKWLRDLTYAALPWWGTAYFPSLGNWLPFGAKALLAIWTSKLMKLRGALRRDGDTYQDDIGDIENQAGDERWAMCIRDISAVTGLNRTTIIRAKQTLAHVGVFRLQENILDDGGNGPDLFIPNHNFTIIETPSTTPGFVRYEFEK